MVKKVLFFDIDGTLLNSELKIPEGVKKELKRLKDAGHYLFVASGRPLAFISNQVIEAGFDGFVLCNGAHVELNHKIIFENRIPYEKVVGLMKMLDEIIIKNLSRNWRCNNSAGAALFNHDTYCDFTYIICSITAEPCMIIFCGIILR